MKYIVKVEAVDNDGNKKTWIYMPLKSKEDLYNTLENNDEKSLFMKMLKYHIENI